MDVKEVTPKIKIANLAPILEFSESDQTHPAGMWRTRVNGDQMLIERATAVDWSTYTAILTLSSSGAVSEYGDDVLFTLGNDNDQVMLNRSTVLAADTALSGVLIGAPDTPALAANSFIIANKTANGDILIAGNDGGNSRTALYFDASEDRTYLGWSGGVIVQGPGYDKIQFGGATDWGTGATGTLIDGTGWDWVTQTVGHVDSGALATACAAAYHALTVTPATHTTASSFFGTWTELYLQASQNFANAANNAAVWGQVEGGATITTSDQTGCFTTGGYFNIIMGDSLTNHANHAINGVRVQSEISTTSITNNGRIAAFEALTKSGKQNWDFGLHIAGATIPIKAWNVTGDAYVSLDSGDDAVAGNKGLAFYAAADEDIEIINLTNTTGTPRVFWDESDNAFSFSGANIALDNTYGIALRASDGTDTKALYHDVSGRIILQGAADLYLQYTTNSDILCWAGSDAGTGRTLLLYASTASAGATLQDAPAIMLRAQYWNDSANTAWPFKIFHDMVTASTTPKSHVDFSINSVDILTLENDNGTPSIIFSGYSTTPSYHELTEMSAPGAGAANTARIYALEGAGDALTDLCAVFQDGTIDVFAQEATEPDSPIFEFPDNTQLSLMMRKPDRKTIQFVAGFPDGREFVMREIRYPVVRW